MISQFPTFITMRLPGVALLMLFIIPMDIATAKINTGSDGIAVHGHDVVAYFLEGRAVKGTSEFEYAWQDAKWQFSSEANKKLFADNPERYAPQYGGFCAVCLALDSELTDANPKAWTIVDGKLYLNYSMYQRTQWRIRSSTYVKFGDEEWAKATALTQETYPIAVLTHGLYYGGRPWRQPGNPDGAFQGIGASIYRAIRQQSSFSIRYADEPWEDPSARSEVNRGGGWPFTGTNVDRKDVWTLDGDARYMTPNLEQVYRLGHDLGVDAISMYFFQPRWKQPQWPVYVYVIDIEQQRVYAQKGTNTEASELVARAFGEFVAGRKQ
jgi:YHS domain-containing protein